MSWLVGLRHRVAEGVDAAHRDDSQFERRQQSRCSPPCRFSLPSLLHPHSLLAHAPMRISIPRIDYVPSLPPSLQVSVDVAAERLALFLEQGKQNGNGTVILCGAGVSVDRCVPSHLKAQNSKRVNVIIRHSVAIASRHCSGIRAYRGKGGSYNVNRSYRPIFFHEFVADQYFRQRYWARSYLGRAIVVSLPCLQNDVLLTTCTSVSGYPPVQKAQANKTHFAIAALEYMGYLQPGLITQNVDR